MPEPGARARTLDQLHLWWAFTPDQKPGIVSRIADAVVSPVAGLFRAPRPIEPPAAGETAAVADARLVPRQPDRLAGAQQPARRRRVRVAERGPGGHDRQRRERTRIIEQSLEFKYTASKSASDWLGQRLAEQRRHVEESEGALQRYREQNDAVSLEERQNIVVQKLADLNSAVTRAKTERIQKEVAYNQIRNLQINSSSLDAIPAILSNQFVQQQKTELAELQRQQAQLSEKLGARHPDMVKLRLAVDQAETKIQAEINKVVLAMRNDYETSLTQEQALMRALEQQKQDALVFNRSIEYGALRKRGGEHRQIFDSLMQRTKETGISGELEDEQHPHRRRRGGAAFARALKKLMNLAIGAFGGALRVRLRLLLRYVDDRIVAIDRFTGLPFSAWSRGLRLPGTAVALLHRGVQPGFGEALRTLRTNVLFSSTADGSSRSSTSSGPGEGVRRGRYPALALAQTGQRAARRRRHAPSPRA